MKVTLLLFASAREAAGCARAELELPDGATAGEAKAAAVARFPPLAALAGSLQIAVDREMAPPERWLHDGAELALLPPVAGGAGGAEDRFRLSHEPLVAVTAERLVAAPGFGGLVTFAGTVRGESGGRRVLRLEYEAYTPMALAQLRDIGERLERTHGARLCLFHRLGSLSVGEVAVIVCAAAPHRGPAFRACEEGIAQLKAEVAIWKREVYDDGAAWQPAARS